ncbi:hypothetical protein OnM2_076039 [Erysiphe neolycopersici]|uniref:Uncharacterized protein n=1 Tax=Erysiphe neolycopersici TaxID=212602 RepID=A0A420HI72_9PEZI|nr:hypothetical protein OnM2_076039 [Erysiphe neolycopersici]
MRDMPQEWVLERESDEKRYVKSWTNKCAPVIGHVCYFSS